MREQIPLIWFYGITPGVFNAIVPVCVTAEKWPLDQFVVALTEEQRTVRPNSPVEAAFRHYLISETKRRLHQSVFASQVMLAYETRCAVCRIEHRELLNAAHIVPDSDPRGLPVIPNGLALCKIHHAAYDRNILGIRPDYTVEIHSRLLDELDGPMPPPRPAGPPRPAADAGPESPRRSPGSAAARSPLRRVPRCLTPQRWLARPMMGA